MTFNFVKLQKFDEVSWQDGSPPCVGRIAISDALRNLLRYFITFDSMFKQTVIAEGAEVVLRIPKNLVGKELEITATIKKGKKTAVAPLTPLTDDDWALPGRPATDEELEQLAEAMDKETGGDDAATVFARIRKTFSQDG
jgi:hypothetical protein